MPPLWVGSLEGGGGRHRSGRWWCRVPPLWGGEPGGWRRTTWFGPLVVSCAATVGWGAWRVAADDMVRAAGGVVCRHCGWGSLEGGGVRHRFGPAVVSCAATVGGGAWRVAADDMVRAVGGVVCRHCGVGSLEGGGGRHGSGRWWCRVPPLWGGEPGGWRRTTWFGPLVVSCAASVGWGSLEGGGGRLSGRWWCRVPPVWGGGAWRVAADDMVRAGGGVVCRQCGVGSLEGGGGRLRAVGGVVCRQCGVGEPGGWRRTTSVGPSEVSCAATVGWGAWRVAADDKDLAVGGVVCRHPRETCLAHRPTGVSASPEHAHCLWSCERRG